MACRLGTHTNSSLRRRLYTFTASPTSLHYRSSAATIAARSQPCPIRQLSSPSSVQQQPPPPRGLLAPVVSVDLYSCLPDINRESSFHAITSWHNNNKNHHRQYRCFHSSSLYYDESDEMSAKEKKKALKAKAKAATTAAADAEAVAENEEAAVAEPQKQDDGDEPSTTVQVAEEGDASITTKDSTSKEAAAAPASSPTADISESPSREYSTPELTKDAAKHKAGLKDATRPDFQNPLHHNNEDMEKIFPEDFDSPEEFQKSISPVFPFDAPDGKVTAPGYLHEIADEIVHLTMLEMNELVNKIADHYGFHEGMLSPDGSDDGGGGDDGGDDDEEGGGGAAAVAEKRTAFDVKLVGFDAKAKIKVIKEVRSIVPGLGLKEAKELVEGAPKVIQKGINMELAEEIKAKLEELGATVEIV